jgi:glyoxylase-like metal-dependent hydrolase (beta-lactamase superfamily II)
MIDCGAGRDPDAIVENIQEAHLDPRAITPLILTHCHVDHIGSAAFFRENYQCSIVAHDLDADAIESGDKTLTAARWYNTTLPRVMVDRRLKGDNEIIACGEHQIHCLHTPGHTPGSLCLYSETSKSLISGDTIFSYGSFGRYDFPGGDADLLRQSIERLAKLDVVNLYPGHESIVEGDGKKHMNMVLRSIRSLM